MDRGEAFRNLLQGKRCFHPASVFDPLSARIAEHVGFELGLMAGSTASLAVLGAPDLALLTATEFVEQARRICRVFNRPLVVDADHGYGNALNVMRTVEELAAAGVAAATIEDTLLPASFGATGKPDLISIEEGAGKMRAALTARPYPSFHVIGRTSAPVISNLDDAISRLRAYEATGVDALFVIGLKTAEHLRRVSAATTLPLIVNAVIAGVSLDEMAELRVRICLQGHRPMMAAVQAVYRTMKALHDGIAPAEIEGTAPPTLMKELTRQAKYEADSKSFMN